MYGLLTYGRTSKGLEPIYNFQKRMLRIIYGKKRDYPSHELFEESKILLVQELYSFELIKFSLKALRQETPSTYLNNFYRTTESALQNRNSQKGLLATLECENKYQKTSLRLRGTQPINVLLKQDLIPPNVHQLDQNCFTKLLRKLKFCSK